MLRISTSVGDSWFSGGGDQACDRPEIPRISPEGHTLAFEQLTWQNWCMNDEIRDSLEAGLGDKYQIKRLLGRGGMGAVYLAEDSALGREVAIKVLPPDVTSSVGKERFRREGQTAAKLSHPNIVPLHSFGEVDGMMYFVMGYVPGGSLADRVLNEGQLAPDAVKQIMVEVLDALDYAHRKGVVHRDIKPDNIMLDQETGRPMLTDFGVAKAGASGNTLTAVGAPIGTPYYMSPEQASGNSDIDGRSDLYSLGVMAYALLSGYLPFSGDDLQSILNQHITKTPAPLRSVAPDVPVALSSVVMKSLSKAPNERWRDAGHMRNALQRAHGGLVEKREWFDGLFFGRLIPFAWILGYLDAFATATNPDVDPEYFGLSRYLLPVIFERPTFVLAVLAIPILGVVLFQRKKAGWNGSGLVEMTFRQPGWWRGWWPAPLRHPATAQVWRGLPMGLKCVYTAYDLSVIGIALTILPATALLLAMSPDSLETYASTSWPFLGDFTSATSGLTDSPDALVMWIGLIAYAATTIWAFRRGLSIAEAHHIASANALYPSHENLDFWARPNVASLLRIPRPDLDPTGTLSTSPSGLATQIVDAVTLHSQFFGELESTVRQQATDMRARIELVDAQLEGFRRQADPKQVSKLRQQIQQMDAGVSDTDTEKQIRDLLAKQLKILDGIAHRIEAAEKEKEELVGGLSALFHEVRKIVARQSTPTETLRGLIQNNARLCAT